MDNPPRIKVAALDGKFTERLLAAQGRLSARPRSEVPAGRRGLIPLGLSKERDGILYVPTRYRADRPAPLVIMLHGAGGDARHGLEPFRNLADGAGTLLLAIDARDATWDVVIDSYGPDVVFLNQALAWTFERYAVDPALIAIEGFSDGASYALSLGLANGDLISHVIAFSPGFISPPSQAGMPRLFISHGMLDGVLPVDACGRRIAELVRQEKYELHYLEFDGPHTIPVEVARRALDWFLGLQRA